MSTSEKQIAANRRNAKKSTGPRTPEGKAVASRNAVKHGLRARDPILKSPHLNENPEEYKRLLDTLYDELKPQGIIQEHLVLKIVNIMWRYRRVIDAETSKINRQLESAAYDIERGDHLRFVTDPDDADDRILARHETNLVGVNSVPDQSFRDSLMTYEMRLDRQLTRAFRLLYQLQLAQSSKTLQDLTDTREIQPNETISSTSPAPPNPIPNTDNPDHTD
ncbi:MAG: hypothetical protein OEV49_05520 [candidate division Zixibacteria bacterium]|nr:hypothetical protein [candidate division Zixibacteria bacterium]MDH3936222.1 hypothetical protein [candidate division Zixibacteria bacterium]MDH4032740.1 hypothetical protein [candidate division Zixibacteria bacterium]